MLQLLPAAQVKTWTEQSVVHVLTGAVRLRVTTPVLRSALHKNAVHKGLHQFSLANLGAILSSSRPPRDPCQSRPVSGASLHRDTSLR